MSAAAEPYVGPRPFAVEDADIFFGRDREASELMSLAVAHPVVLVYAPSGAGKTSLINARIVPWLREKRGAQVFDAARVSGTIPPSMPASAIGNIFVFHALRSMDKNADHRSLANLTLVEFLKQQPYPETQPGAIAAPRIVVFDQFEEIFTSAAERWRDRQGFFDQVSEALENDRRLRFVFAMREEFIAALDPHADGLPERLRTRFRLERLRGPSALLAVQEPAKRKGYVFTDTAAQKLVTNLLRTTTPSALGVADPSGEFVDPVQLQVVCRSLWQAIGDTRTIDEQLVESYGNVDQALTKYYDACLVRLVEAGGQEGAIRRWFEEKLIIGGKTRGLVFAESAGLPPEIIAQLDAQHLIRPEVRSGQQWYELSHDRFIEPILRSNRRRRESLGGLSARLEARAATWKERKSLPELLLDRHDLSEASQWLDSPEATQQGASGDLREFVAASERMLKLRDRNIVVKQRWQMLILAGALAGALGGLVVLAIQKKQITDALASEAAARAQADKAVLDAKKARLSQQKESERNRGLEDHLKAVLFEAGTSVKQIDASVAAAQTTAPAPSGEVTGWMFLGSLKGDQWSTKTIEIANQQRPEVGKTYRVINPVNLRSDKPNKDYSMFGAVVDVIKEGDTIRVDSLVDESVYGNGRIWCQVTRLKSAAPAPAPPVESSQVRTVNNQPAKVVILIASDDQRPAATRFNAALQQAGFQVGLIQLIGPSGFVPSSVEVRRFSTDGECVKAALDILDIFRRVTTAKARVSYVLPDPSSRPELFEVWMSKQALPDAPPPAAN